MEAGHKEDRKGERRGLFSERTQISLTKEEKAEIEALKAALGVSMSEIIRRGVDQLLSSMREDKRVSQAILRQTAGSWSREVSGLDYQRQLREAEDERLKRSGLA